MKTQTPLERLRYHVSGAIARGESVAVAGIPAFPTDERVREILTMLTALLQTAFILLPPLLILALCYCAKGGPVPPNTRK